jgi:hypothetical protein
MIIWLLFVFTATNILLWLPWLFKDEKFDLEGAQHVLQRIFPIKRGIF